MHRRVLPLRHGRGAEFGPGGGVVAQGGRPGPGRSGAVSHGKYLRARGDGTKTTTEAFEGIDARIDAGCTALGISRLHADHDPDCTETYEVLRRRCCSTCGMTSPGLAAMTAGEEQHLKRCGDCPARGSRARYCSKACHRVDWVPRHRAECAEARRARQAAGTEV